MGMIDRLEPLHWRFAFVLLVPLILLCGMLHAGDATAPRFTVRAEPVFKQLTPKFCWFHPRVTPLPGYGKDDQPAVIMTIQKHLAADDHYSGLYFLRTN